MSQRQLVATYVVEILSRLSAARDHALSLLALDHVSAAPKKLASAVRNTTEFLAVAIQAIYQEYQASERDEKDTILTLRTLQTADGLLREIASHLRYVEAATTYKLPWTMVSAFEDWAREFLPETTLMLRPQWRYNYTFTLWDFRQQYSTALEEFQGYSAHLHVHNDVLKDFGAPFYIISFPALERENILLHTLLGHEIGHLLVDDFLTEELTGEFLTSVRDAVTSATRKFLDEQGLSEEEVGGLLRPEIEKVTIAQNLRQVAYIWRRALEELLSDISGAYLFGPASLFSTFELAFQYGFDDPPTASNGFYPPWRRRLREVLVVLEEVDQNFFPVNSAAFPSGDASKRSKALAEHHELIRLTAERRTDEGAVNGLRLARIAYAAVPEFLRRGKQYLLEVCKLQDHIPLADTLYRATPALIDRLDHEIPPDQKGESSVHRIPSNFVEIINASWLHKLSKQVTLNPTSDPFDQDVLLGRTIRNRLTLKAIEYVNLSEKHKGWLEGRNDLG